MVFKVGGRRYSRRPIRRRRVQAVAIRTKRKPTRNLKKFQGVKYFTEMFNAGSLTLGGGVSSQLGQFKVRLNDIPNNVQYTSLFDKYNITRFDVILVPRGQFTTLTDQTPYWTVPRLTYAINRDGDSTPLSESSIMAESNAKVRMLSGTRPIVIPVYKCKPNVGQLALNGASAVPIQTESKWLWLDTNRDDIAPSNVFFYGVNYSLQGDVALAGRPLLPVVDVYYRVYCAFKEQQ